MTVQRRARPVWAVLLVALVFEGGYAWRSAVEPVTDEDARLDSAERNASAIAKLWNPVNPATAARIVPVFDAGSLDVRQTEDESSPEAPPVPEKRPPHPSEHRETLPEPAHTAQPEDAERIEPEPRPAQVAQEGSWPTLEADYSELGFGRYLEIIERLGGRFYLLVNGALGPEVSLREGRILGPGVTDGMATARPHLVTDGAINGLLSGVDVPPGASRSRVVLLLSSWLDEFLWREIGGASAGHGVAVEDVALIQAVYVSDRSGVYLRLDAAVVRKGGRRVALARTVRLPL